MCTIKMTELCILCIIFYFFCSKSLKERALKHHEHVKEKKHPLWKPVYPSTNHQINASDINDYWIEIDCKEYDKENTTKNDCGLFQTLVQYTYKKSTQEHIKKKHHYPTNIHQKELAIWWIYPVPKKIVHNYLLFVFKYLYCTTLSNYLIITHLPLIVAHNKTSSSLYVAHGYILCNTNITV